MSVFRGIIGSCWTRAQDTFHWHPICTDRELWPQGVWKCVCVCVCVWVSELYSPLMKWFLLNSKEKWTTNSHLILNVWITSFGFYAPPLWSYSAINYINSKLQKLNDLNMIIIICFFSKVFAVLLMTILIISEQIS